MIYKQKDLAIQLSRLHTFTQPSSRLEQYATDSELAAQFLWNAYLHGAIEGKVIADFGCGTGILGLGALLLGAKKVYFVDIDSEALALAKDNFATLQQNTKHSYSAEFVLKPVESFTTHVDVVLQNPPFGVQQEHADKIFLETAMQRAHVIYTIHKVESNAFLTALATEHGFKITSFTKTLFPLKKTQSFHTKKIYEVPIGIWSLERYRKV